jgi:hypothetical protein
MSPRYEGKPKSRVARGIRAASSGDPSRPSARSCSAGTDVAWSHASRGYYGTYLPFERVAATHGCSMFARLSRSNPVAGGTTRHQDRVNCNVSPQSAGSIMKSQLVATGNRTEQRTLNPRVRGSSPWRRTRSDLVFLSSLYPGRMPFPGHVCSTFARQSGPSRPGWPARPARPLPMAIHSVTSRRKVQVEGLLLMRPGSAPGGAVTPGPPVRYTGGPSEVHARSMPVASVCAPPGSASRSHRLDSFLEGTKSCGPVAATSCHRAAGMGRLVPAGGHGVLGQMI